MSTEPRGIRPDDEFRRLEHREAFRGRIVGVSVDTVALPGGAQLDHEFIHLPSAVGIVPLLRVGDETEVILVEQFRCSVEGWMHEIPAGVIEPGEMPIDCAHRELAEETGYRAGRMTPLASVLAIPGTSNHSMHYFLAEELEAGESALEVGECLEVKRFGLRSLVDSLLAAAGPAAERIVVDAKTHLGLLHVAALLERRSLPEAP